jgi:LysM repeat protein
MRVFASPFRLVSLFSSAAIVAVSVALLTLSGCGHHCGCHNKCNSCKSCNTCNTCNVSDNSSSGCSTCQTGTCSACQTGGYDRVGAAPQSLSEPVQTQSSTYSSSNTSFERVGESRELPSFSPAPSSAPAPTFSPAPAPAPAFTPATQLPPTSAPRSSGGGQYHSLQRGETIYALSRQYGVKPKVIMEANHFTDPNHLAVGTKVYIPAN